MWGGANMIIGRGPPKKLKICMTYYMHKPKPGPVSASAALLGTAHSHP